VKFTREDERSISAGAAKRAPRRLPICRAAMPARFSGYRLMLAFDDSPDTLRHIFGANIPFYRSSLVTPPLAIGACFSPSHCHFAFAFHARRSFFLPPATWIPSLSFPLSSTLFLFSAGHARRAAFAGFFA